MQNSHLLLDKLDKLIFHKNLDIFFFTFPYIHVGNMFVGDMPYKSMFNDMYNAIFVESFDDLNREDQYSLGFVFLYNWKVFIHLDMMFPPL
jgi:hypothetical protein